MRFTETLLGEIKARITVSDLVRRTVPMKRAGREWKALSPFNKEKSPSFYVNDQKQMWHCFSSGKSGDIFTWLIETEGLAFPEAVERLAADAGVEIPKSSAEAVEREQRHHDLSDVATLSNGYFQKALASTAGREATLYLARRDVPPRAQVEFGIGCAPAERHGLKDYLAGQAVPAEMMIASGMIVAKEGIAVSYDRFQNRLMFPIHDGRGRLIAFGGRALGVDQQPKYLNSPETEIFQKGSVLYNLHRARKPAHDSRRIIVVEGYMGAIAMVMMGFPETVATLGTAVSEAHLDVLWKMAPEPIIIFDGDAAGRRAMDRTISVALPHVSPERTLRFVALPAGQDPDDLRRASRVDTVRAALERPTPLITRLWEREVDAGPTDTPEQRAALQQRLDAAISVIQHAGVRKLYRDEFWRLFRERFQSKPGKKTVPRGLSPRAEAAMRGLIERAGRGPVYDDL